MRLRLRLLDELIHNLDGHVILDGNSIGYHYHQSQLGLREKTTPLLRTILPLDAPVPIIPPRKGNPRALPLAPGILEHRSAPVVEPERGPVDRRPLGRRHPGGRVRQAGKVQQAVGPDQRQRAACVVRVLRVGAQLRQARLRVRDRVELGRRAVGFAVDA
ncbi:hypothetical protein VTK56DRAFT_3378 [Thermocarpiscus australiensis]